jgi:hypothetical protein
MEIINAAVAQLQKNVGITVPVDEKSLMKQIANEVINRPGSLKMNDWHCGTAHCIGGWACVLNPLAKQIEKENSTFIASVAVLPSYVPVFFISDSEALEMLKLEANETA